MTEEELLEKLSMRIYNHIRETYWGRFYPDANHDKEEYRKLAKKVMEDIHEAGWKSPEEVKQRMKDILSEHPLASEYESDARYTWPERWIKLMEYFNCEGQPMDLPLEAP
jgi:hypothetical protein